VNGFIVRATQCRTCIYRRDSPLDLAGLERAIADPRLPGFFKGYRICHHTTASCCRGFWRRNRNNFTLGQLAQRLGFVRFSDKEDDNG